jgi:16S rRNA (uracil1498-N3)-methyltransferase
VKDPLAYSGGKVRLYVEAALADATRVETAEAQSHYLLHVMRAHVGDRVSLFNGRDGEWLAKITSVTKRRCVLICERQTCTQCNTPDLWLCFAPIKKTPADYLTQKATELGVSALQPVMTRRTIVSRVNTERMRANAIEAAEQSERLTVPDIREPLSLEKLLASWPADRQLMFCDEASEAPPIRDALAARLKSAWAVLTGPEGGFDAAERKRIRSQAFVTPVSLGPRILRADTAALAALSVWQASAGDWR